MHSVARWYLVKDEENGTAENKPAGLVAQAGYLVNMRVVLVVEELRM